MTMTSLCTGVVPEPARQVAQAGAPSAVAGRVAHALPWLGNPAAYAWFATLQSRLVTNSGPTSMIRSYLNKVGMYYSKLIPLKRLVCLGTSISKLVNCILFRFFCTIKSLDKYLFNCSRVATQSYLDAKAGLKAIT